MYDNINLLTINEKKTIKEAIKQLNENRLQILAVVNQDNILTGTITDGDIRRTILNNISFDEPLSVIMNKTPKFVFADENQKAYNLMLKYKLKAVPVVDKDKKVIGLVRIEDYLGAKKEYEEKSNYIFIMAGGKGTRLDPFTKILPKPLIPIGDKPIIEVIMRNFRKYGFNNFIISLNYKADYIKIYFSENPDGYNISYTLEKEALGTAGAIRLAREELKETFIVSNCDVIIEVDFEEFLHYHQLHQNDATIVGVVKNMQIPYGVIEAENGKLIKMTEKPEYNVVINSGVYALEPKLIDLISEGEPINMPDLLLKAKSEGFKIGVYPVSSNWFDVGQWEEYQRTLDYFKKVDAI